MTQNLAKSIKTYESDTFSASGSKITKWESEQIAETLVVRAIQQMINTDTMDGCDITDELISLRDM